MASGPSALNSSRPILATPNHGRSSAASRCASTRSSRSSASARRRPDLVGAPARPPITHRQSVRRRHPCVTSSLSVSATAFSRPVRWRCTGTSVPDRLAPCRAPDHRRIGEARRAHLHRTRTGHAASRRHPRRGRCRPPPRSAGPATQRARRTRRARPPDGWPGPRAHLRARRARGPPGLDVDHHAHQGVDERDGLGPGSGRRPATSTRRSVLAAELRPPRSTRRRGRGHHRRGRRPGRGRTGACHRPGSGHERLTSTATTCSGHSGDRLGGAGVVLDVTAPDAGHDRGAAATSGGSSSATHAATPGPWRPTLLSMPGGGRVHPGRGVARPGLGAQRLHHHRAQARRGPCRRASSVAVAGGARCRHDRRSTSASEPTRTAVSTGAPGPPRPCRRSDRPLTAAVAHRRTRVVLLQAAHRQIGADPVGDAVRRGERGRGGGQQRHLVRRRGRPDVGAVGARPTTPRAVDDQVDLARPRSGRPRRPRRQRPVARGVRRGVNLATTWLTGTPAASSSAAVPEVATIVKPSSTNRRAARAPTCLSRSASEKNTRARGRHRVARGQLGLGERHADGRVDAHDLARGAHLGPEHRVDVGEAAPRQHRLLDRDVVALDLRAQEALLGAAPRGWRRT